MIGIRKSETFIAISTPFGKKISARKPIFTTVVAPKSVSLLTLPVLEMVHKSELKPEFFHSSALVNAVTKVILKYQFPFVQK